MRGRVFGKTLLRAGSPALGQSILRLTKSLRGSDLSDYGLKLVCWASEPRRKAFTHFGGDNRAPVVLAFHLALLWYWDDD